MVSSRLLEFAQESGQYPDVITGPAQTSFLSYTTDRIASRADQEYA